MPEKRGAVDNLNMIANAKSQQNFALHKPSLNALKGVIKCSKNRALCVLLSSLAVEISALVCSKSV